MASVYPPNDFKVGMGSSSTPRFSYFPRQAQIKIQGAQIEKYRETGSQTLRIMRGFEVNHRTYPNHRCGLHLYGDASF